MHQKMQKKVLAIAKIFIYNRSIRKEIRMEELEQIKKLFNDFILEAEKFIEERS